MLTCEKLTMTQNTKYAQCSKGNKNKWADKGPTSFKRSSTTELANGALMRGQYSTADSACKVSKFVQ